MRPAPPHYTGREVNDVNQPPDATLPLHPVPELPDAGSWLLTISDGAIDVALTRSAVASLAHVDLDDAFTCLKGWSTGILHWHGVPLAALLARVAQAGRPYVAVSAPDTRAVIPLSELPATAILADTLNRRPLPREHGGPYRLVVPGGVCFTSVKWVQRLELCSTTEGETASGRARGLLGQA
jgi:DMSO/TMAO reductase YedYZ molybdopterin-dependent catalytic subunit